MATVNRTFTLFSELPRELRDEIWSLATRDESGHHAEVHFLTASDADDYQEFPDYTKNALVQGLRGIITKNEVDGALPVQRYSGVCQEDWTRMRRNPSTYTIHDGLWNACSESRATIQRQRRQARMVLLSSGGRTVQTEAADSASGGSTTKTCFFVDDQGDKLHFRVHPHGPICVKPFDLLKVYLDAEYIHESQIREHWSGAEHVAVEFDPNWEVPLEWQFSDPVYSDGYLCPHVNRALAAARIFLQHMWLIDYRIKRAPGRRGKGGRVRKDRFVFYGNGCRFIEVRRTDSEWEVFGLPLVSAAELGDSVFTFLRRLEEEYWLWCRGHDDHDYERWHADDPNFWPLSDMDAAVRDGFEWGAIQGVLACEPWD